MFACKVLFEPFTCYILSYLNFRLFVVVSRYCDPQLQVGKNFINRIFSFEIKYLQILMFQHSFHAHYCDFIS